MRMRYRVWRWVSWLLVRIAPRWTLRMDSRIGRLEIKEASDRLEAKFEELAREIAIWEETTEDESTHTTSL